MKTLSLANDAAAADAAQIPYVTPSEAQQLLLVEWQRMLALIESLDEADWTRPTACTEWDVRAMTAHQAGAYASGTGYREMLHQYASNPNADAINARQLADRAGKSAAELIEEIKSTGAKAAHNWAYSFRLLKPLGVSDPTLGWLTVRHLMLVIHSRDAWIHRLDICRATNRPFEQTEEHDGRINALVVRDLARTLSPKLGTQGISLRLTGAAGASWTIGRGPAAAAIQMGTLDFNIYASGRMKPEEAAICAEFSGDRELAERAFRSFAVLY